jgi:hypothetical protein
MSSGSSRLNLLSVAEGSRICSVLVVFDRLGAERESETRIPSAAAIRWTVDQEGLRPVSMWESHEGCMSASSATVLAELPLDTELADRATQRGLTGSPDTAGGHAQRTLPGPASRFHAFELK